MPPVFLGVIYHWLGGLASGSFYVPYKAVKKWSWEVYWLAGGFVSWIIAPWILALCLTKGLFPSLIETFKTNPQSLAWAYLFGCLWGIGGLTFGLTMRFLGMSLGMAIALGYCTVLGTIMPPIFDGSFGSSMETDPAFVVTILGLGVCMLGVILAGVAGTSKEREMDAESKKAAIKEFSFVKGIIVATISGVFSACMAYGIQAAQPLADFSVARGTSELFAGLPKLCVVLLGGFTSNFIWCAILLLKNKTTYQFFNKEIKNPDAATEGTETVKVNMVWNYAFAGLAGLTWYFQFFFYTMGESKMGEFVFSSWTLHMASIIIFSSLWGLALHEWRGTSKFTKFVLGFAIFTLLYSTVVVGYGNLMKTDPTTVSAIAAKDANGALEAMKAAPDDLAVVEKSALASRKAVKTAVGAVVKALDQADQAKAIDESLQKTSSASFAKAASVEGVKKSTQLALAAALDIAKQATAANAFEGAAENEKELVAASEAIAKAQNLAEFETIEKSLAPKQESEK